MTELNTTHEFEPHFFHALNSSQRIQDQLRPEHALLPPADVVVDSSTYGIQSVSDSNVFVEYTAPADSTRFSLGNSAVDDGILFPQLTESFTYHNFYSNQGYRFAAPKTLGPWRRPPSPPDVIPAALSCDWIDAKNEETTSRIWKHANNSDTIYPSIEEIKQNSLNGLMTIAKGAYEKPFEDWKYPWHKCIKTEVSAALLIDIIELNIHAVSSAFSRLNKKWVWS
ncbi:uncharacterized protein LOC120777144 [Bactrocera tryoni]|uniref:uncharacterized protein LOC120777144 n=1 Tax=Bactrocera tryoni TaxID=59916 RepID=UPI001A9A0984|nr:uncharacterized protein LOC120777144 [Bactrocera tryoni]